VIGGTGLFGLRQTLFHREIHQRLPATLDGLRYRRNLLNRPPEDYNRC
jgi:hypothetical protein